MKFVDEIEIRIKGGHGGQGLVHFRREKYRPLGGPDGGDGGRGGDLYIEANPGMQTLGHFMKSEMYKAFDGENGKSNNMTGKDGEDLIIQAPPGTQIRDADTDELLGDLDRPAMRILVGRGGRGGRGNASFATSQNQAPHFAQTGEAGLDRVLKLSLKLLADAGLIGLPNAGKSTILSKISRSHPKIADYAFTTLIPNLGVVENEERRLLIADIPGIIEGAHRGAGLGLSFLRHIERVGLIVYVIDISSLDPAGELVMLQSELASYSPKLLTQPALLVLNKMDLVDYDSQFIEEAKKSLTHPKLWSKSQGIPKLVSLSALESSGITHLIQTMFSFFNEATFAEKLLPKASPPTLIDATDDPSSGVSVYFSPSQDSFKNLNDEDDNPTREERYES